LILDAVACVSDKQFAAIKTYLSEGGIAWLALPFGTHDEKGVVRKLALSSELKKNRYKNLVLTASAIASTPLEKLIAANAFKPVIKQIKGDNQWVARIQLYNGKPVIQFMNTALKAIPHASLKDLSGIPILIGLDAATKDNELVYEINTTNFSLGNLSIVSPELNDLARAAIIKKKTHSSTPCS